MAKCKLDLEQVESVLRDTENLLAVFWWFFAEERPDEEKYDPAAALWFLQSCKPYESVLNAAWDKVRQVRTDVNTAIEKGSDVV